MLLVNIIKKKLNYLINLFLNTLIIVLIKKNIIINFHHILIN